MNPALFQLYDDPPDRRQSAVQLFISHDHGDVDLARVVVSAIELAFEVPRGAIRCTSLPGYRLDLGARTSEALRRDLTGATVVIGLLTKASLRSSWVLFELGAAWGHDKTAIPLIAGELEEADIPPALREVIAGHLTDPTMGAQFLDQLGRLLGWREGNRDAAVAMFGRMTAP